MGRPQLRMIAVGAVVAVLAVACTGDAGEDAREDDAEVLGIQVEREGDDVATFEPTEPALPTDPGTDPGTDPALEATTDATEPAPAPTGGTSLTGTTTDADDDEPAPADDAPAAPSPRPAPPASSPSPSPSPSPEAEVRELSTREGHSFLTWFRDEEPDGQGGSTYVWGEVSASPTVTREGSEPLRVTLVDLDAQEDRSAPRRAQCRSWLEVDGDAAVRARGTVTVEVVVDGEIVSSGTRSVDVTVAPGERADLVAIGDVRVAVPDVAEVTCRVGFTQGSAG